MSNGKPVSGSSYIIICSGRIGVALNKTYDDKVAAASICAARFAAFMGMVYGDRDDFAADLAPVTKIQHELMSHAIKQHVLSHEELDQKFIDLFVAMTTMEGEY